MQDGKKAVGFAALFQFVLAGLIITSGWFPRSVLQWLERLEWFLVPGVKLLPTPCGFPPEEGSLPPIVRVFLSLSVNLAAHSAIAYLGLQLLRRVDWRTVNEASVE